MEIMGSRWSSTVVLSLILGFTLACGSTPREEVDAAQAAIEKARAADAEIWAPAEFEAAEEAMNGARSEIAAQDGKWFKSYGRARELLAAAQEQGTKAGEAALANKERTQTDTEATIASADSTLREAESSLGPSRSDAALYREDIAKLGASLNAAREELAAGDYRKALENATSVESQAKLILTQIEEGRRRPRTVPDK